MSSNILNDIETQIAGLKTATLRSNTGIVRESGDGVAKIEGLSDVMLNEMIEFPGGLFGLALNLEENEVGAILLGDATHIKEGDEVKTTGRLLSVPVGKALLGRVVDSLGRPLDGKGPIASDVFYPVEKVAPGIITRKGVSQPVQTGIMAIDAMIPIGRGQRELIIGDRATGKTTIAIDTIINQARINKAHAGVDGFRPIYSIYVAVGQKLSTVASLHKLLADHGDAIEMDRIYWDEHWFTLRSKKEGVSVKDLATKYGIETLRAYKQRSEREIDAMRKAERLQG